MKIRGSITVFVSVVLSVLIAFSGVVIDLSRFRAGEKHARAAVQLSVQSALTQYFSPLRKNYGLWGNAYSKEELEVLIYDLLEKNLSIENMYIPGIADLYGFSVDKVTVYPMYDLADEKVLEKEITEFMKYRAPVNTLGLFLEKLKAFNMFMAQSGLLNKRMDLEDRLQQVREEQVYLSLALSEKIPVFLNDGKPMKEIRDRLDLMFSLSSEIKSIEETGGKLDRTYRAMLQLITAVKEERGKTEVIDNETAQDEETRLQSAIDTCVEMLSVIRENTGTIKEKLNEIRDCIGRYIRYHEESIKLVSDILEQSDEIKKLSEEIDEEIKRQSEKSDNAFLVKIKADIQKLVLTTDADVLNSIKTGLESNLQILRETYEVTGSAVAKTDRITENIRDFINRVQKIHETLEYPEMEFFSPEIVQLVDSVNDKIYSSVQVYRVSSYKVEPAVNQKEKNEFYRWCNKVFDENNETVNKDKGYEKKLRDNIKNADKKGKKENEKSFNGKDGELSDKELNELFNSLPSNKSEEEGSLSIGDDNNSEPEEYYKKSLNSIGDIAAGIGSILSETGNSLLKNLYVNEYIVSAFKNANIDKVQTPRINVHGGPAKSFFEKAEVEYIIFGNKKEKTNANLAQASIFGIRMGLNLIHVYMDPSKTAAALSAALAISGWTGFGVPVVKNLILIGWAAGESYLDLKDINDGKDVPVYKTKNTWKLSLDSLFSGIAGEFLEDSSEWLKKEKNERIDKANDAVQELIRDLVAGAVNNAFLPLEQAITEHGEESDNAGNISITVSGTLEDIESIDDLKKLIEEICLNQYHSVKDKASGWTKAKLEHYKNRLTEEITSFIIESNAYNKLFSFLKDKIDNLIDGSIGLVDDSLQQIGSKVQDQDMQSQLVGTVVSFNYTDYLRLLLIAVPMKTKLLRSADIIQLNLMETLDNPDFKMSEYNSFLIVEAEVSMRAMFIPSFLNTARNGQFKIRWGYGY